MQRKICLESFQGWKIHLIKVVHASSLYLPKVAAIDNFSSDINAAEKMVTQAAFVKWLAREQAQSARDALATPIV